VFIQTVGVSAAAGAIRSGTERALGQDKAEPTVLGPGAVRATFRVNGQAMVAQIEPGTTLLEALRERLDLTGAKPVCERASCGACSVLVDGKLVASCMMLALDATDAEITTVEGLGEAGALDPVQEAFIRHDALQCGFCTPGLVVAARALLNEIPKPSLSQIKKGLAGNICRCGTYTNVFNAVLDASGQAPIRDGKGA
jgi:aerobic-type carbon monoxide dehydrogenase small subunit (CoxS/CutS family)